MSTESIDAVAMVRKIRDDIYEETKDLSSEELIAYYQRKADAMHSQVRERSTRAGLGSGGESRSA
jgi:hypothetical protein